ncbi:MAG: dynamin family protein, partial [Candidatus Rokubacteria bacterium]|nr:dynamin family protein [Candidatus Rokubacteria bacterium]
MADPDFTEALGCIAELAVELGAAGVAAEAAALGERLAEGRFFVACVGQVKRGKSTLLNALVGDPILPTGVVPVTSVVTVVRHGPRRAARVRLAGRPWAAIDPATLAAYVSEDLNPQNRKGAEGVEVFLPSALLASGMCLVDTPGIGSVFSGNTRVTRDFVPHVDAALVVLGADPPLSGEELALVEEVAGHADQLVFVLNKADRLSAGERDQARAFAERVLQERLGRPVARLLQVSATEALAGRPTRDWGLLTARLETLARDAGAHLVRSAAERGVARLTDRLARIIDERHDALVRPLDESERRLAGLRQAVQDAERALKDLGPLFAAEQQRLAQALRDERGRFLADALPAAMRELEQALGTSEGVAKLALRPRTMEEARRIGRDHVDRWLRDIEPKAEGLYREATARFVELANAFLARLRGSGESALGRLPGELPPETSFRAKRHFYFTEMLPITGVGAGAWLAAALGPRR